MRFNSLNNLRVSALKLILVTIIFFFTGERAYAGDSNHQTVKTHQSQQLNQLSSLVDKTPKYHFTFAWYVQVAVNIANRIVKAVMKMKQREAMVAMLAKVSYMGRDMSGAATSGSQLARLAKLLQQPEVDYQAYLNAAKEVAEARRLTEENLKSAAEIREAAARELDDAKARLFEYSKSRGGEDFEATAQKLVLQDAAVQVNNYVESIQQEKKSMDAVAATLDQVESGEGAAQKQASIALNRAAFTANETPAVTADMLKNTTKEQFSAVSTSVTQASEAHQAAAKATEAFTNAGNAYVKYLEEKGLSEHPTGDAKADELRAELEKLANGLVDPYRRIDETSQDASSQLNEALGIQGATDEKK